MQTPSLLSEAVNVIHTKEVRTKTHNTVDGFQLGRFCRVRRKEDRDDAAKDKL